ncbi:MAG TPA: aminotransferase class IV, partial [Thermoleophilia bacterium]|nr:aminotransferase class IV [Thermoleophilia bacterium]
MLGPALNHLGDGAEGLLYLNGRFLRPEEGCIGVEDRGFLFGDGVYEALKVLNGRCLWLSEHLARLGESCREIDLEFPWAKHPLPEILPRLTEESGIEAGLVYLQVTRGVSPRDFDYTRGLEPTVMALIRPLTFPDEATFRRG